MADAEPEAPPSGPPESPQALVGFMSNAEWDSLLAQVGAMIEEMERLPFPEVKERVFELLAGIDAIHREAMRRLVRLFKEGVLEKVITDPPIHTLMELYDLLPAADAAAPDGEAPKPRFPAIPIKVVASPRATATAASSPSTYARWIPAPVTLAELPRGTVREFDVDSLPIVLCRAGDALFAMESSCALDGRSLAGGTLTGFTLGCPNHQGCLYDVRQGTRLASADRLTCYPVKADDTGRILIGLGMPFTPRLPTF
jgi:nitrite reductase/ring-hydroxylating ferredoxin subunit